MTALFRSLDPGFAEFLTGAGASTEGPHWPVARNFLLDEGIGRERAGHYRSHGAMAAHASPEDWRISHNAYLKEWVRIENDDLGPPGYIDADDPEGCPDTFRFPVSHSALGHALATDLIRVQKVSSLTRALKESAGDLTALAAVALEGEREASRRLDEVLGRFARKRNYQPVFAGLWEDLSDLFGAAPDQDPPGWADDLRDRLGLDGYDPKQSDPIAPAERGLDILVFRYPVGAVPRLSGLTGRARPLTVPCVLDGGFSPAFCPSPRGFGTGHTVDLAGARSCDKLTREILHPAMGLRSEYLFRIGSIQRPVASDAMQVQRGLHLTCLRKNFERPHYGEHTDRDLLL
uniref:Uncharacterized protein n=1 Tax=Candidatus Kentrum sp. FM TaxID=2126340 RepID=A0A450SR12_9GAMM|nr:MAG: hypothetical protein BECKFM1743C_GA0114222_101753 [Candidatus Kentron sp. FM]VFJ56597.1 MAG: hypothetical protein BECKFM1743A_GA0114220_101713 [Candidatus Kentron sp. FM]VFK11251.1 MAG: hypothetical protein BECKFM1743B_GA0114221_101733 [Candidatus Kentron sp. FM]